MALNILDQIRDVTAAGKALCVAATAAIQRTALGLGSAALADTADFDAAGDAAAAETAAKAYADSLVTGIWKDQGLYDASSNTFPVDADTIGAVPITSGMLWRVSVAGTLGGVAVGVGDQIRALVDAPGQTASNWYVVEGNDGYVAENSANKKTTLTAPNDTDYPTTQAVANAINSVQGTLVPVTASRNLLVSDYDQTLEIQANLTLTGVGGLAPGRRIYAIIKGAFTLTMGGTCFNRNGATQASGDGALVSIDIDSAARPVWSSNGLA